MTDPSQLTLAEGCFLGALLLLMGWETYRCWNQRDPIATVKPTLILVVILLYYCVVGPLRGIATGQWTAGGVSLREGAVWAWAGAFIFFAGVLFGFYNLPPWRPAQALPRQLPPEWARRIGGRLNLLGLALYALAAGPAVLAQLNPFQAARLQGEFQGLGVDFGALANALNLSLNFLIPGTLMLFAAWLQERRGGAQVLLWTVVASALFLTSGFRWRLVVLLAPMLLLWYLGRQRRPQLLVLSLFSVILVLVSGYIGLTRTYGEGLDVEQGSRIGFAEIVDSAFQESGIFFTSGGVMRQIPEASPYVGLTPLLNSAAFFVPRQLWPEKPGNEYLSQAVLTLYANPAYAAGSAILNFAEYYLMFGWLSLVAMSAGLGFLLRGLYEWLLLRRHDPSAQATYAIAVGFLYMVVSRGYLAQVVGLFCFTVLPLFLLRRTVRVRPAGP